MVFLRASRYLFALIAVVGLCLPLPIASAVGQPSQSAGVANVVDVELGQNGLLIGRLLSPQGQPIGQADVSILTSNQPVATTRTDAHGIFAVTGLHGGVHQISTANSLQLCRLWTHNTAPPQSPTSVEVVAGSNVVRGQWGPPPGNSFVRQCKCLATNPFVIGGVVAAAVAIPVALSDDHGPHS
jgi:hypothetical protein